MFAIFVIHKILIPADIDINREMTTNTVLNINPKKPDGYYENPQVLNLRVV